LGRLHLNSPSFSHAMLIFAEQCRNVGRSEDRVTENADVGAWWLPLVLGSDVSIRCARHAPVSDPNALRSPEICAVYVLNITSSSSTLPKSTREAFALDNACLAIALHCRCIASCQTLCSVLTECNECNVFCTRSLLGKF
jgi:hypothetical protein